ncbi:hypothetical protein [Rubellimicrobium arenae]|uniref:hypothetical protein n=1 Tax=Rubellimicrobium arenae TaxID=2817372 RepID=UPI001B304349|nr:hypothetical protein [Rubellimicrobium arenae]
MSLNAYWLAIAIGLGGTLAWAEPRQHGNVIYDLPSDWSTGRLEAGVQLLQYDGPEETCRFCYLHLGPGATAQGRLEDWLAAESLRFVDPEDRASIDIVEDAHLAGHEPRPFAIMAMRVDSSILVAFAFEAAGRYEAVGFEGYAYEQQDLVRSFTFLQDEVSTLLDRLRFVSEGASPLLPAAEPGSLSGLWWGWWLRPVMQIDLTMQMTQDHRTIAFWPDGRSYDGRPPNGLLELDPGVLAASIDPDWGVYRESRGALELYYADGRKELLSANGAGWSDRDRTLVQVEPLPDGAPLSGTISAFSYTGFTPGSGIEGGISSSSSTTFYPDGHYEGESFGGAFGNLVDGAGSTTGGFATSGGSGIQGGRYKVRHGLVIMRPADGSAPRAELIYRLPNGEIMLGDQVIDDD